MSYTEYLIGLKPNTTLKAPPVVSYFQVTFFPGYLNYVKVAKLVITAITHLRIEELAALFFNERYKKSETKDVCKIIRKNYPDTHR